MTKQSNRNRRRMQQGGFDGGSLGKFDLAHVVSWPISVAYLLTPAFRQVPESPA